MNAEIITIGNEVLDGNTVNTNAVFIAKKLTSIGIRIYQQKTISDDKEQIMDAIIDARSRSKVIIMTGGLGTTRDDITKRTLCSYFNDTLVQDPTVYEHIKQLYKDKPQEMITLNKSQSFVPANAKIIPNQYGTAPALWFEDKDFVLVALPGMPQEMQHIITEEIIPRLRIRYKRPYIIYQNYTIYGVSETIIANKLEQWEERLPHHISVAYLPSNGRLKLRLTIKGINKVDLEAEVAKQDKILKSLIGEYIKIAPNKDIVSKIADLLKKHHKTLSVVESCTVGAISKRIGSQAGASDFFLGGITAYSNLSKIKILGIERHIIKEYNAVSIETVSAMVEHTKELFQSDYAIATTGIAGPTTDDSNEDVGTVYIAILTPKNIYSLKFVFTGNRQTIIEKACNKAMEVLLEYLQMDFETMINSC